MTENGIAPLPLYFNDSSRHFVAGSVSGMIAKYIEYPADTIKVRLQTEPGRFTGALHCIHETYERRGLLGFYRGITAPLVGAVFENAIGFGAYSYTSAALGEPDPRTAPISIVGLAGASCGAVISFLQTPLELIKCRMQSGLTQVRYRGTLDCLIHTVREDGVRSVFRGLSSTLIREIPGSATYFIMYEVGVRAMCRQDSADQRGSVPIMLAGSMGGAGYWLAGYPADVIKSRQQIGHPGSFWRIGMAILRNEGISAMFKGLSLTLIRAAPANAAVFLVYEYALKYLP